MKKTIGSLLSFFILFWVSILEATPRFKSCPMDVEVIYKKTLDYNLLDLLSSVGNPPRIWEMTKNDEFPQHEVPPWLSINKTTEHWVGTPNTPAQLKSYQFQLTVVDNESADVCPFTFIHVKAKPRWTNLPNTLDLLVAQEDKSFSFELSPHVENPGAGIAGYQLSYSKSQNTPSWLTLDPATGKLTGIPRRKDVGTFDGFEFTVTNKDGSSVTKAKIVVLKTIHPPRWTQNPIQLPNAIEASLFQQNLVPFIENQEAMVLHCGKEDAAQWPAWLSLNQACELIGTPGINDAVPVSVKVRFDSDPFEGQVYFDVTTVKFGVTPINHPPQWKVDPLVLPDGFHGKSYSQGLSNSVADPDNDPLTFSILPASAECAHTPPTWIKVNATTGVLSGTPLKSDVGLNQVCVRASDGELWDDVVVEIKIIKSNEPPIWLAHPTILPTVQEDQHVMVDLNPYTMDPDGDKLEFTKLGGPNWIQISPTGSLTGTPGFADVGLQKFMAKVCDNIAGCDTTDILFEVEHVNHAPYWVLNPILLKVKEDASIQIDVSGYAKDPDPGDMLQFSFTSGPSWAVISDKGVITGKPGAGEVGVNHFRVRVTDQGALYAEADLTIEVEHVNHRPKWIQDPITYTTPEGVFFQATVAAFAEDSDPGDQLKFFKVSGPSWLSISTTGEISGTPKRSDVGLNKFQVRVVDLEGLDALGNLYITVERVNIAPRCLARPIYMTDAYESNQYQFNFKDYVKDDDGDLLTYTKKSGPDWLLIAGNGLATGKVALPEGTFPVEFEVTDNQAAVVCQAELKVIEVNDPPAFKPMIFSVKEREILNVNLLDPQNPYITDQEGDPISCQLLTPAPWVKVSSDCKLEAKPTHAELGQNQQKVYTFKLRAEDGEDDNTNGVIEITVLRNPQPPVWLVNPIEYEVAANAPFTGETLAGKAQDPDGWPLTFKGTQSWLVVGASGSLSGTPTDSHIGLNTFTVEACNDVLCSPAQLLITVVKNTEVIKVVIGEPVPGAETENLWVVDSSPYSANLMNSVAGCIEYYYNPINHPASPLLPLTHAGVFLSSDWLNFRANPIRSGNLLMTSDDSNNPEDFRDRTRLAWANNCSNTPIWTLYNFYKKFPTIAGYFKQNVPAEVLIVGNQTDYFRHYASQDPATANWQAGEFVTKFKQINSAKNKRITISTISCQCSYCGKEPPKEEKPRQSIYGYLADQTGGKCYSPANAGIGNILASYAASVRLRANIHAKSEITLTPPPISGDAEFKVSLAGKPLFGNTGSPADLWTFAAPDKIIVHWALIDISTLNPSDELRIEYRIAKDGQKLVALRH